MAQRRFRNARSLVPIAVEADIQPVVLDEPVLRVRVLLFWPCRNRTRAGEYALAPRRDCVWRCNFHQRHEL